MEKYSSAVVKHVVITQTSFVWVNTTLYLGIFHVDSLEANMLILVKKIHAPLALYGILERNTILNSVSSFLLLGKLLNLFEPVVFSVNPILGRATYQYVLQMVTCEHPA